MIRSDGRATDALRPVTIEAQYLKYAEGSALITLGNTRVLCAASIEERVPPWMKGRGVGWVTAEYSMLPRATQERTQREASKGRLGGRTHEIQRIIGRALRAVTDMAKLGERTIWLDCDVLQADGGTRTAAVTGAWVALAIALLSRFDIKARASWPLLGQIAAISVGIVDGYTLLDLAYDEDSRAQVDLNVFMTDAGKFTELQGTAEAAPFSRDELDTLLKAAEGGITQLLAAQRAAVEPLGYPVLAHAR
jgi:ribonuclease PH